jgi:nucleotide-binding universal stress UspA family protein
MSYRKILAPIFGSSCDRISLQSGLALARQFNAHLETLFVRFDPAQAPQLGFLGGDVSGYSARYFIDAAIKAADDAQSAAAASFAKAVDKSGVDVTDSPSTQNHASAELKVVQGDFADRIEEESRLADLVVFSGEGGELAIERAREALESVLLSGARPVLFVTAGLDGADIGQRIALAFDGSASAAHAVTAALPFIKRAKAVHAFEVTEAPKSSTALMDLKRYLALHGVEVKTHAIDPGTEDTEEALLSAVQKEHCDLLVLGGYGHSRVREFVFGGVTRHVLRCGALPAVLMAH